MNLTSFLTCALVAGLSAASLDIPAVDRVVSSALNEYAAYTAYDGPTGTAAVSAKATPETKNHAVMAGVTDPSYWLADIKHQGYAPYAPSADSYVVFRNVKDYGAVGR